MLIELTAGSLVLQNALERHFAGGLYCDLPMGGVYLVRGENLAMLGELVSVCLPRLCDRLVAVGGLHSRGLVRLPPRSKNPRIAKHCFAGSCERRCQPAVETSQLGGS